MTPPVVGGNHRVSGDHVVAADHHLCYILMTNPAGVVVSADHGVSADYSMGGDHVVAADHGVCSDFSWVG